MKQINPFLLLKEVETVRLAIKSLAFTMLVLMMNYSVGAQCPTGITNGISGVYCVSSPATTFDGGDASSDWTLENGQAVVIASGTGPSFSIPAQAIAGETEIFVVKQTNACNGFVPFQQSFTVRNPSVSISASGVGYYIAEVSQSSISNSSGPGTNWNDGGNHQVFYQICNSGSGTVSITISEGGCTATLPVTYQGVDPSISGPMSIQCGSSATFTGSQNGGTGVFSVSPAAAGSFSGNVFTADPGYSGSATITYDVTYNYVVPYDAGQNATVNCAATAPIDIICGGCNLTVSESHTNVNCAGGNDGSATVTPAGANGVINYLWSDGSTDAARTGMAAGNYTVTATDGANCTASTTLEITEPAFAVTANCSYTNATIGHNNGTASVAGNGGTLPYSYLWTTSETTSQIVGLAPGAYTVVVSDALGCTSECSIFIIQGFPLPTLLHHFSVVEKNCKPNLSWSTEAESNTRYFSILRKAAAESDFHQIGRVNAQGYSNQMLNYEYTDLHTTDQTYTYKIMIVDQDGQESESDQKSLTLNCASSGNVAVFPNPVAGILSIRIAAELSDTYQIKIADLTGRILLSQSIETASAIIPLNVSGWSNGLYQVSISNSTETKTFKIQKY
ncbi:MAG: T9SS type A sorting domain-containing protein [Chitinophagaceae bacterium]|nr:T9SS type A sorting domain-containing protein [Chitinophagaceae bacterium]